MKRYLSWISPQVWTKHHRSHAALTGSRLPCVAHPDASAEQPLDAKPVEQKQDVILPPSDDPRMLESCENHKRGPNPGQTASGPLRTATHRGNRFGWPTQPGLGGGGADSAQRHNKYSVWFNSRRLILGKGCFYNLIWSFQWGQSGDGCNRPVSDPAWPLS